MAVERKKKKNIDTCCLEGASVCSVQTESNQYTQTKVQWFRFSSGWTPAVRSEHFIGVLTCFLLLPVVFFDIWKVFFFVFFCNTQLHVSFYWHGHPGVTWLLPRGAGPFRSDACPAAVAESCPPGQQKVIFKWLIFTTRLRRSDLHKSPLVWRVSFTCPFTRLYPRGRQRRTRLGDEAHAEKTHDNRSEEVNYSTLLNTRYYILV